MTKRINSSLRWFESSLVSNSEASIFSHKSVKTVSDEHLQFGKLYTLWVNHLQRFSSVFPVLFGRYWTFIVYLYHACIASTSPSSPCPSVKHPSCWLRIIFINFLLIYFQVRQKIMILLSKIRPWKIAVCEYNIAERRRLQWQ